MPLNGKTFDFLAAQEEVYSWASTKGWEPDPGRPFADACALMHSEVSEALEAYRVHKFADATDGKSGKPEGVGSELADVLIRLLHYSFAYSIPIDQDTTILNLFSKVRDVCAPLTFGTECAFMHNYISGAFSAWELGDLYMVSGFLSRLYALIRVCGDNHGIDLVAEYERKMRYNHTRSYRHGNRAM